MNKNKIINYGILLFLTILFISLFINAINSMKNNGSGLNYKPIFNTEEIMRYKIIFHKLP